MKHISQVSLVILLFLLGYSCQSLNTKNHTVDENLVGSWSGSEKDEQIKGMLKNWVQQRFKDGTKITYFTYIYDGEEDKTIEKGRWWTENGFFYETTGENIDIYKYEIVDKNHILFKAKKLSPTFENQNYEFVDTRTEQDSATLKHPF